MSLKNYEIKILLLILLLIIIITTIIIILIINTVMGPSSGQSNFITAIKEEKKS